MATLTTFDSESLRNRQLTTLENRPVTTFEQAVQASLLDSYRLLELSNTRLLDSLPEACFDRFTRLATTVLGVPISMISFLAPNRQFIKSAVGLVKPYSETRQLPLTHSFCKYVVHSEQPLIVADAAKTSFLKHNPAARDLSFRGYLGIPIDVNGHTIGTFCAIDTIAREWTDSECSVMKDLAEGVMTEINYRISSFELELRGRELEIIKEEFQALFGFQGEDGSSQSPVPRDRETTKEITKKLTFLALHDPLTQCYNRNYLPRAYENAQDQVKSGNPCAILSLDFDNFKNVNDSAGHAAGDRFLINCAKLIKGCLRVEDELIRIGGDEFIVILKNIAANKAQYLADRIRKKINEFVFHDSKHDFKVTVSIGLSEIQEGVSMEKLLSTVDGACYLAKSQGGNQVVLG